MAIWRYGKEVGPVEERTFLAKAKAPAWATRGPAEGQYRRLAGDGAGDWYCVVYCWFEEAHQHE